MMTIVGYARVSTTDQTLDAQRELLAASGAAKIFEEKQSGTKTDRKELANARAARILIERNPLLARWGTSALLRLAASIRNSRAESDLPGASDDWDLVPAFDLWGIPLLPLPKAP